MSLLEKIRRAETIVISGHVRPDGDCVGSCLALLRYIRENEKEKKVKVYLNQIPDSFRVVVKDDVIYNKEENAITVDLFIALDCGSIDRLGEFEPVFMAAKDTICIDHHISNTKFAKENIVEPGASSTCEVLYGLFDKERISKGIAEALYLGIVHDTGVFKHTNTTRRTMEIAGDLLEKGVNSAQIIDGTFYEKTYLQNQILGRCLLESMLILEGKCIVSAISHKTMEFYGVTASDLDGVIDQLRVTKGVEVAMFIYEMDTQTYKVSLRSNGIVDVSKIAVYFGGGGHVKAAGCTMHGVMHDVINNISNLIDRQLNNK